MQNSELDNIAASMNDAIHRAYALGRGDALRRVVEMVQADELGGKTVALLGPADSAPSAADPHHSEPHAIEVAAPAETPVHAIDAAAGSHQQASHAPAGTEEPAPWWRR